MPPYMELPNPNAAPSESDIIPIIFFIYKEKPVLPSARVTMRNSKGIGAMGVLTPLPGGDYLFFTGIFLYFNLFIYK